MLRVILITLAVLFALRLFARLTVPRGRAPNVARADEREVSNRAPQASRWEPALSAAERQRLEAERELALREGRQLDAIEIHRRLTGLDANDAKDEVDAPGRGSPS